VNIFNWITIVLWFAFMVYWLASALSAKRSVRGGSWLRGAGFRVALIVIIFLAIRSGLFQQFSEYFSYQSSTAGTLNILLGVIGVALCVAGFAFAVWARVYLGRNWGMPMTLQEGHELVTSGPYAFVRHPIYTGFLLAMAGSIFADGTIWLGILVVAGIYFIYSAKTEEKIMRQQFPNEYPGYIQRTKMLIPFVW
jgi:protein-S-isoprenylcysteine O-methyltransferase Ste14